MPKLRLRARSDAPERPNSVNINRIDHRPTSVTYYDNIVRPQPLPPFDQALQNNEVNKYIFLYLMFLELGIYTCLNYAMNNSL